MKLPKSTACQSAADGGNFKRLTMTEESPADRLLDTGSIPVISILKFKSKYKKPMIFKVIGFYIELKRIFNM